MKMQMSKSPQVDPFPKLVMSCPWKKMVDDQRVRYGKPADMWSLGCILYEPLGCRIPFIWRGLF